MSLATAPSPIHFYESLAAFQLSAALKSALELDIFTAIGQGYDTPESLAQHCRIAIRGARILADYLVINRFLEKKNGRYALTLDSAAFLDRRSPDFAGQPLEFIQAPHVHAQFAALTERVRLGGAPPSGNMLEPNHEVWTRFARAMAGHHAFPAQCLARLILSGLPPPMPRPVKILDIAAGHGLYGIAFARQNPLARIIAQDWPSVLTVALENASKAGVTNRYVTLPGSAFEVPFGNGYDLALLTNFIHHFDKPTNITLLEKVRAALNPGAMAAILEFAPNDDRITPTAHGSFAIFMLATTPAGDVYTVSEIAATYAAAGFHSVRAAEIGPGMQRVVTATA